MRRDPKALYDGFRTCQKGVNSRIPPDLLPRDQFSYAVNTTFRGFFPRNRPGIVRRVLTFATGTQTNFEAAVFQGAAAFQRARCLTTSIGGRLFRIGLDSWDVQDITTATPNADNRYRAWFQEIEDFMIVQDGESAPWIYDGANNRRADSMGVNGTKEVPVGSAMGACQGRLWVALQDGRGFVASDLTGDPTGTPQYNFRDAVLKFTANDVINEGGAFAVPLNAGNITAMLPVAQIDTSTGQGPLQVFTPTAVFSINAPTDRTQWKNLRYPIQTISLIKNGSLSDRATVSVNGDAWMRSLDGIRSFVTARRDFGTWVNTPLSEEVIRGIRADDLNLLSYASACLFDNRLLMSVNPYRSWDHGIAHRGLVALDFAPASFLQNRLSPAWEGTWSGLTILQIISGTFEGIERCFIFALSPSLTIQLYEVTHDDDSDYDGTNFVPIQWAIEGGAYGFPNQGGIGGVDVISLSGGNLWADELNGRVTFAAKYRADEDPCWHDWHSWSICANNFTCGSGPCVTPLTLKTQYRKPFNLPAPISDCDPSTGKPVNVGRMFQPRIEITGSCRLKQLRMIARQEDEDVSDVCASSEIQCASVACCEPNDFVMTLTPSPSNQIIPVNPPPPPPPPTGACCLPGGSCVVVTASQCTALGGTYIGDNISCADANCPPPPPDTKTLVVQSIDPASGVIITVTPADINSQSNGTTPFSRIYTTGTGVSLTAPPSANGKAFLKWKVDGVDQVGNPIGIGMNANHTAVAVFGPNPPPVILPDLRCGASQDTIPWIVDGRSYRYPSAANQADDPNVIFDPAFIDWWKQQVINYFLASGITFSSYQLVWFWELNSNGLGWNALTCYEFDACHTPYNGDGWGLEITYCP